MWVEGESLTHTPENHRQIPSLYITWISDSLGELGWGTCLTRFSSVWMKAAVMGHQENRSSVFFPLMTTLDSEIILREEDFSGDTPCAGVHSLFSSSHQWGDQPSASSVSFSFPASLLPNQLVQQSGSRLPELQTSLCSVSSAALRRTGSQAHLPHPSIHTPAGPALSTYPRSSWFVPNLSFLSSSSPTTNYQNTWRVWTIHSQHFFFTAQFLPLNQPVKLLWAVQSQ